MTNIKNGYSLVQLLDNESTEVGLFIVPTSDISVFKDQVLTCRENDYDNDEIAEFLDEEWGRVHTELIII